MLKLYRNIRNNRDSFEECFYIEPQRELALQEIELLKWLICGSRDDVSQEFIFESSFKDEEVIEIGPRLSFETPFSSNAVAICKYMGLPIQRIEKSTRYSKKNRKDQESHEHIMNNYFDSMTQAVYKISLTTFDTGLEPKPVSIVNILENGEAVLRNVNTELGLGMDDLDISYYTKLFKRLGRNPTDVELFQIGNANSEHSRHWFFRGNQVIDKKPMSKTLMEIVKETLKKDSNSLVSFRDNSGVMRGPETLIFAPKNPECPSQFVIISSIQHITATAETHNHPTLIAPFPGAETGSGGRIRDNRAVGRGGLVHAGLAGYCVGNLNIADCAIPGETTKGKYSRRHALPIDILIKGSNGISDYGNKIGEPLIGGFCRSFGLVINDARREFIKPVFYSAGMGRVLDQHTIKQIPEKGMLIIRIGGPAYRVGIGGGSASSIAHGAQDEELDFKSVQRGNAEMENRTNRVIQACCELLDRNPIESIHDQGAGGPSNVITELIEPAGGRVDIRKIVVGDRTMSVLEIWVAEYQEGYGLLIKPKNLKMFKLICDRERVNCEILGEITCDGQVVVYDSNDNTEPVKLSLSDILSGMPRKQFESEHIKHNNKPLIIPKDLTIENALQMVFKLPQVCSKGFLTRKVDRSVTGLVARQQCCGPMQVPVADVAVTADGYFGLTGAATAIGEQPIKMMISPCAGARMAVAEMLTNLCSAKITKLSDVKCRANWMWSPKQPGEGALLYDAAIAMRDIMLQLEIGIDGGKDSLSMSTKINNDIVISPGELVIMGYAPVRDITKVITPDLKGSGFLGFINLGGSNRRLGGSALAQALGQIGDESPDLDIGGAQYLRHAFEAVQELIENGLITAYHDISDGGLITAVSEMCIAGNRGICLKYDPNTELLPTLFCEEAGILFEFAAESRVSINETMSKHGVSYEEISDQTTNQTSCEKDKFCILSGDNVLFSRKITELREWWEATSTALELEQTHKEAVEDERKSYTNDRVLEYKLSFVPKPVNILPVNTLQTYKPKVAIIREEGTNGDREMGAAFYTAGFEPWDITMSDLLEGRITSLDNFRGIIFPGGFSYADVFGSARGWAGPIRFNPHVKEIFDRFYDRSDTFSLGVCNGCQLMANIGWLPFRGISESSQPQFLLNKSGRFESRWIGVRIIPSKSILLQGMENSVLGINVAHGEGQLFFPDPKIVNFIKDNKLVCLEYVDPNGQPTESYPYNPNGSPLGWTSLCSLDGRHLAMMPHPERSFLKWQWPWMPKEFSNLESSPWLRMFQNAYDWCNKNIKNV